MHTHQNLTYRSSGLAMLVLIGSISILTADATQGQGRGGFTPTPIAPRPSQPPIIRPSGGRIPLPIPNIGGLTPGGRSAANSPFPAAAPPAQSEPSPSVRQRNEPVNSGRRADHRNNVAAQDRFQRLQEAYAAQNQRTWVYPPASYYPYDWAGAMYSPAYSTYVGPFGSYGVLPYGYMPYGNYPMGAYPFGYYPTIGAPPPGAALTPTIEGNASAENSIVWNDRRLDPAIRRAAQDIQQAWMSGNLEALAVYTRRDAKIEVQNMDAAAEAVDVSGFLNRMRSDLQISTMAFSFDAPELLDQRTYRLTGHRTVRDANGSERTNKLQYTLQKAEGHYYITQFVIE